MGNKQRYQWGVFSVREPSHWAQLRSSYEKRKKRAAIRFSSSSAVFVLILKESLHAVGVFVVLFRKCLVLKLGRRAGCDLSALSFGASEGACGGTSGKNQKADWEQSSAF